MKIILVLLIFFALVQAQDNNESEPSIALGEYAQDAFGIKLSYGEGNGIVYRIFLDDLYIDNTLFIAGQKDDYAAYFYGSYDISLGYYFYESADKWLNLKSLVSIGYDYSYDKYYNGSEVNTINITNTYRVFGGFGAEIGSRKSGNVVLGLDLLYGVMTENNFDKIRINPGISAQLMYIW